MRHPEFRYIDTAIGGPAGRNNVIELSQWKERIPADRREVYHTWHRFPAAYLEHVQTAKSVAGYDGVSYADFIPFDFDGPDLDAVQSTVRTVLQDLQVRFDVTHGVRAYFSGAKGFHILLDAELFGGWSPSVELAANLRTLAERLMSDYQGFDSAVYDRNRLLRCANTQHGKSELWKVPLSIGEVQTLSIEQIKELAAAPRKVDWPAWGDCETSSGLAEIWQQAQAPPARDRAPRAAASSLWQRGLREGDGRDNAAFALARMLRKKGLDESDTMEILRLWDDKQADPLGDRVLELKVASTYRMAQETEEQGDAILTYSDLADAYHRHLEQLKQRKMTLGLPAVDHRIRGVVPGEVCTVIARSGVGKTILAQNIILNVTQASHESSSLFVSLEQPDIMCFERAAQMVTGRSGSSVEDDWCFEHRRANIRDAVTDAFGDRALTAVKSATLESLGRLVDKAEAKLGGHLSLVVIDYLGYIGSDSRAPLYERLSTVARGIKQFAKDRDLAVVLLCQVGRAAGEDGATPLTKSAARDSGAIEESADILLGLYRPNMGKQGDTILAVQILKNRKGLEGETYSYDLDRVSLRITGDGTHLSADELPAEMFVHPNN